MADQVDWAAVEYRHHRDQLRFIEMARAAAAEKTREANERAQTFAAVMEVAFFGRSNNG